MRMAGCGWWWPHRGAVILTERPSELHLDREGRLHAEHGPAIAYPDGWRMHYWHGTCVPAEWIDSPDTLDPQAALSWPNIEQRRAAAEILGWERVLQQLRPRVIDAHHDPQIGTLLQVDLPDAPAQRFLRVLCPTGRTFALPVPSDCQTAIEAQARCYGVDEDTIRKLEVRT
jgi:hypothetical protein